MPELPEIKSRARELNTALHGKIISSAEVLQPASLNLSPEQFSENLKNKNVLEALSLGKWIQIRLENSWLLINLGMGGEILLLTRETLPEKVRTIIEFVDGTCLAINFWWFGYVHYVPEGELQNHKMFAKVGPEILDVDEELFRESLAGKRGRVKNFLLNQSNFSGIGNAYIHDILFLAKLHPLRSINTLSEAEISRLFTSISKGLVSSLNKGGAFYEVDIY